MTAAANPRDSGYAGSSSAGSASTLASVKGGGGGGVEGMGMGVGNPRDSGGSLAGGLAEALRQRQAAMRGGE